MEIPSREKNIPQSLVDFDRIIIIDQNHSKAVKILTANHGSLVIEVVI